MRAFESRTYLPASYRRAIWWCAVRSLDKAWPNDGRNFLDAAMHSPLPQRVIFDRSGQSCRPVHVCFAPKADLRLAITGRRRLELGRKSVIQAPKLANLESELTAHEWAVIEPMQRGCSRGVSQTHPAVPKIFRRVSGPDQKSVTEN
jgi:hypothetical protein